MDLQKQFVEIAELIQDARSRALSVVNRELIELYWEIGKYISQKVEDDSWGKSIVQSLSDFLKEEYPDLKGFSAQNMWRMKQFFECYKDCEKLSAVLREISWTNNLMILSKTKTVEEREFYIRLCIKERYSSRELERQIDSGYYERYLLSDGKAPVAVTELYPDAPGIFKDSYMFEFLNLPDTHLEKDLQKAIIRNLKKFILELGKDFIFIGEEYKLQVGNCDFYMDLLFYNRELSCLVAFELKIDSFKPEYLGKINFYLEALDRDVKKPHENPSVGVILCKSKDDDVVEYALSRNLSPALVADYNTKLIDKKLLQQKLHELFELSAEQVEMNKDDYV
jgi:predicted nuclease of restriction endonuclease-like (RecB) superfamily